MPFAGLIRAQHLGSKEAAVPFAASGQHEPGPASGITPKKRRRMLISGAVPNVLLE